MLHTGMEKEEIRHTKIQPRDLLCAWWDITLCLVSQRHARLLSASCGIMHQANRVNPVAVLSMLMQQDVRS